MIKPRIGLLPLYLELYDEVVPEVRCQAEKFTQLIAVGLEKRGLTVFTAPTCRIKKEFSISVKSFEKKNAHAIVTLHLAYSPSLESIEELSRTKIPIIILDTTPAFNFGPKQKADFMFNHGIHGVQDMCSMLIRNNKHFAIEAGHWKESDVLDRVAKHVKGAVIVKSISNSRVGIIGKPFKGMGDFHLPKNIMKKTIGITTIIASKKDLLKYLPASNHYKVCEEIKEDINKYETNGLNKEAHLDSVRVGLSVRQWIEKENLLAFTMNFLKFDKNFGFPTLPLLEASKAMARGTGYAGEGDVLTAALVGALLSVYPKTTFTEMFCPDWEVNSVFISHLGEVNFNLMSKKPKLVGIESPFFKVKNSVIAAGVLKSGKAVLVNLAPGANKSYTLIISSVNMIDVKNKTSNTIQGWFTPNIPLTEFLSGFSRFGGTHHSALVYGDVTEEIISFGRMMGWNTVTI